MMRISSITSVLQEDGRRLNWAKNRQEEDALHQGHDRGWNGAEEPFGNIAVCELATQTFKAVPESLKREIPVDEKRDRYQFDQKRRDEAHQCKANERPEPIASRRVVLAFQIPTTC